MKFDDMKFHPRLQKTNKGRGIFAFAKSKRHPTQTRTQSLFMCFGG